ncbi:vinexin-like [Gadus chalcogrammus]|uniref:vinexin-like n=1 Tax=Gadus chalcogrammus TaxID=1042646 RepID=UPI0024C47574|nr:vinexin-like [Gadus chalcogrammus]
MDPGVWRPESLWAPGPAPSSLAAKGFRKVQPNLSRRPAAQGNASQSSLPPLSPPPPLRPFTSSPGGRHRGLPLSPSFPPPTTPSSPPSSTSAFGLELRHSRSADHISSDQRSCSPLDQTSTRTRGRDWYRNMYNKIHVVQKADPDSAEAYSSTKGIANKALSSNSPDPGHLPPSPGSGRSSPATHRDRREDCGRYRAEPRSIFDYEPGASSVLEREQPSLHPSDLSVEDEPWFRFFAELEFGRPPPKKTLDEMLNEDSPVPDTLSSRLSGEDRFIQSPASSSDDYIDWGKSQSSISHSSSCHTANHSPVRSNPTNQGQMWPSAPANSCASPIKSREPPKTTFRNSAIPDRKSVAECARVLYNFDAHTSKELSLRKGDVVTITRLVDSNWYEGQLRRAVGIFPVSYVQKICSQPRRPPPPSTPSRSSVLGEAVVRFNFTADTPVELSLRKPRWQTPVADSEQLKPLPLRPHVEPWAAPHGAASSHSSSPSQTALQALTQDWISLTFDLPASISSPLSPFHSHPTGGCASSSALSSPPTPPPLPASFTRYLPCTPAAPLQPGVSTPGPTPPPYPRGLLLEMQELDALLSPFSPYTRSSSPLTDSVVNLSQLRAVPNQLLPSTSSNRSLDLADTDPPACLPHGEPSQLVLASQLEHQTALAREQEEEELSKELASFIHISRPQSRELPAVPPLCDWLNDEEVSDSVADIDLPLLFIDERGNDLDFQGASPGWSAEV